jgi:hypothetical protein
MTVAALKPKVTYKEDGITLIFATTFRYLNPSDLAVSRLRLDAVTEPLEEGVDWNAGPGDSDDGGAVTIAATQPGAWLTIARRTPQNQQIDYHIRDRFPAETHERGLDKSIIIDQELQMQLDNHELRLRIAEYGLRWFVLDPLVNVRDTGLYLHPGVDPPTDFVLDPYVLDPGEF